MAALFMKFCNFGRRMLLFVMGILSVMVVLYQFWEFPSWSYFSALSPGEERGTSLILDRDTLNSGNAVMNHGKFDLVKGVNNAGSKLGLTFDPNRSENDVALGKGLSSMRKFTSVENSVVEQIYILDNSSTEDIDHKNVFGFKNVDVPTNLSTVIGQISLKRLGDLGNNSNTSASTSSSPRNRIKQIAELEAGSRNRDRGSSLRNESLKIERYVRRMRGPTITLSEMKSMLLDGPTSSISVGKLSAARDRELLSARLQIENAPILRNCPDLHAPLFRNVSVFKRSYDLMERVMKIYVYKEGEKPVFHQPRLRGIYSSEGWFMKLLERSKRFSVRDPKKAHLFYLPFSSEVLRMTLYEEKSHSIKNLERYLTNYVDLIRKKYRFWNRTGGADHFMVACHDWAPRVTRQHMSNCIRALCNANVARGFSIRKDVSIPVTYVRSGNDPSRDIGGKPPAERDVLAFFAGHMHGYLRPLLLQYWENKVPDMKIFGPVMGGIEGKAAYREFMKRSKYCICARGYGVHTPRVVESIFYECVPVIISDNYVPPFLEVLDWEAFAVFVQEKDIPSLRNILLSIPEERYLDMQLRVKMVQRHFVWHKIPEKYDLFHMILHSIWYNRVTQIRPK